MTELLADIAAIATTYAPYVFGVVGAVLGLVAAFALGKWVITRVRAAIK